MDQQNNTFSLSEFLGKDKEVKPQAIPQVTPIPEIPVAAKIPDVPENPPDDFETQEVISWLTGQSDIQPAFMSKMMADVSNKMAMYLAVLIVKRMSKLNRVFAYLDKIEQKLFDPSRDISRTPESELRDDYSSLTKVAESFMEFSRKFAIQNKDLITDPERDELANMIRSLDPEALKRMKGLISQFTKVPKKKEIPDDINKVEL